MQLRHGLIPIILLALLAGCDQLGLEDHAAEQAREEAEGKAIGSACRQTGRLLEECYQNNRRSSKAAIFAGWRDMDAYMRENKIEEVKPESPMKLSPAVSSRPPGPAGETADAGHKPVQKNDAESASAAAGADGNAPDSKASEASPARKSRPPLAR